MDINGRDIEMSATASHPNGTIAKPVSHAYDAYTLRYKTDRGYKEGEIIIELDNNRLSTIEWTVSRIGGKIREGWTGNHEHRVASGTVRRPTIHEPDFDYAAFAQSLLDEYGHLGI